MEKLDSVQHASHGQCGGMVPFLWLESSNQFLRLSIRHTWWLYMEFSCFLGFLNFPKGGVDQISQGLATLTKSHLALHEGGGADARHARQAAAELRVGGTGAEPNDHGGGVRKLHLMSGVRSHAPCDQGPGTMVENHQQSPELTRVRTAQPLNSPPETS